MTFPSEAVCRSSSIAEASTLTVSVTTPALRGTSMVAVSPSVKVNSILAVLKPWLSTVNSYLPGERYGTLYCPSPLVCASLVTLVSMFVTVTRALGTTAPDSSVTIPVTVACSPWANAEETSPTVQVAIAIRKHTVRKCIVFFSMMFLLLQGQSQLRTGPNLRASSRHSGQERQNSANPGSYIILLRHLWSN